MKPNKETQCGVCGTPYFERNNYFYGKQFTVRDLLQEQSYFNKKRWLVNRMVLGWGVVCGLDVSWNKEKRELVVTPGVALDCCGHEIVVCEEQRVAFEKNEDACLEAERTQDAAEQNRDAKDAPDAVGKFVLCLEYDECKTEQVELPPIGCDQQERVEYNRVRDGFKLRIKPWKEACPEHPEQHIGCLDRLKVNSGDKEARASCKAKTIHDHLCDGLKKGCPECECCDCVILATLYVKANPISETEPGKDKAKDKAQAEQSGKPNPPAPSPDVRVIACENRRLVYNNTLLYDLIYCHHGDLPHIVDFSWREHAYPNREVEWETFVKMITNGLTVSFDRKMSEQSLNRHTFFLTFFDRQEETGTFVVKRIPAEAVTMGKDEKTGCYTATFVADKAWVDDELDKRNSELAAGVDVEITLRGSRIWSADGKGLDGDFLADRLPTGNGTQGGDFVDWFRVLPRGEKKSPPPPDRSTQKPAPYSL